MDDVRKVNKKATEKKIKGRLAMSETKFDRKKEKLTIFFFFLPLSRSHFKSELGYDIHARFYT